MSARRKSISITHSSCAPAPEPMIVAPGSPLPTTLTPVYPTTEGLSQDRLRKLVQEALEDAVDVEFLVLRVLHAERDVLDSGFLLDGFPRTVVQAEALGHFATIDLLPHQSCCIIGYGCGTYDSEGVFQPGCSETTFSTDGTTDGTTRPSAAAR